MEKKDYRRLIDAARLLKQWDGPTKIAAELTKEGCTVSSQMMTNWKVRGVAKPLIGTISRIIGCRPIWLEFDEGPMTETGSSDAINKQERALLNIYRQSDERGKNEIMYIAERQLEYAVDKQENALLALYRKSDDRGKNEIMHIAERQSEYVLSQNSVPDAHSDHPAGITIERPAETIAAAFGTHSENRQKGGQKK